MRSIDDLSPYDADTQTAAKNPVWSGHFRDRKRIRNAAAPPFGIAGKGLLTTDNFQGHRAEAAPRPVASKHADDRAR